MTADEILDQIQRIGALMEIRGDRLHVEAPKGRLTPDLVEDLKRHKPEVIDYLLSKSCNRIESLNVAIKIESAFGDLWLVSSEAERGLADDGNPIYTAVEARRIVGMPEQIVRQVHELKRVFGGRLDWVEDTAE